MIQVEKRDIGVEQLKDGLRTYFEGRYHSAIVLACAAEQLLAGYVMKHGGTPEWKRARGSMIKISNGLRDHRGDGDDSKPSSEKQIGDFMNHIYNNSKHAGKDGHTLLFDPRLEAQQIIDRAIMNYQEAFLRGDHDLPELPLAQKFLQESANEVTIEKT